MCAVTFLRPLNTIALAIALLMGCQSATTQLVVVIDTDVAEIASVDVEVRGGDASTQSFSRRIVAGTPGAEESRVPFSFGIHSVSGSGAATVVARGRDGTGAIVITARATLPFVRGETRRAVVRLERACASRWEACEADGDTCRDGACADPTLDASALSPIVPGSELDMLPPFPADGGVDGGPVCAPGCDPDETCTTGGCRCGTAPACGAASLCDDGSCVPWPRSCDAIGRGLGCDVLAIPGGTFTMGDEDAFASGATGAHPEQPGITVGAIQLDVYEVTVARFRAFWSAGHPPPSAAVPYPGGRTVDVRAVDEPAPTSIDPRCNWTSAPGDRELHPINCVTRDTALAFCAWDGGRLPTEAEWEHAARGRTVGAHVAGRDYPWGAEAPTGSVAGCDRAQAFGCPGDDGASTRRVGSFERVDGLYDLVGNVGEHTADDFDLYGVGPAMCWRGAAQVDPLCLVPVGTPQTTYRGGGFSSAEGGDDVNGLLLSAARYALDADDVVVISGLRCAY